jgi:hypothetical protein
LARLLPLPVADRLPEVLLPELDLLPELLELDERPLLPVLPDRWLLPPERWLPDAARLDAGARRVRVPPLPPFSPVFCPLPPVVRRLP